MEVPHTPGEGYTPCGYVVGVAGERGMALGGRGNIYPGNRWRDLDQIWHGGSTHPQEGYRICGYVVGVAWPWVGVAILSQATAGGIWTKFVMEFTHTLRKVKGYVSFW